MIHHDITTRGAGFIRAWVFAIWAVHIARNDSSGFTRIPDLEFDPPGLLGLLPGSFYDALITPAGLSILKWTLLAGLLACAIGVRPWRWVAIPTVLLLTLYQGIPRGLFDYVNHKELAALYAAYVLAAFPATAFSPFAPRESKPSSERETAMLRLMMLLLMAVVLIPYCFVGLNRLVNNDMTLWSSQSFASYLTRNSYGTGWFENTDMAEALLTRPWVLQLLAITFPIGTLIEVLAPLCITHRRFRQVWVMSMVGLHLFSWAAMDILFWENLALFPVLLVDRELLLRNLDRIRRRDLPSDVESVVTTNAESQLAGRST